MFSCSDSSIHPVQLTCEYDANAFIDIQNPRLSWINENVKQTLGAGQSAYQIRVSLNATDFSMPVWDWGKILSDKSAFIEYVGTPLKSRTT